MNEKHETKAEQMRQIMVGMSAHELSVWITELSEMKRKVVEEERYLEQQIKVKCEKVQKEMAAFDITNRWDIFLGEISLICRNIKDIWEFIDRYNDLTSTKGDDFPF